MTGGSAGAHLASHFGQLRNKIAQFLLPIIWLVLVARRLPGRSLFSGRGLAGGAASGAALAAIVLVFYVAVLRGTDLTAMAAPRRKLTSGLERMEIVRSSTKAPATPK